MGDKKSRQLKLQTKYRALSGGQRIVPELKLSGVWLEELGFKPGELVSITTQKDLLIIATLKAEDI